ncbi:hypothetical protein EN816_31550 [Mesorhizobium sp. M8A.F.Ca.ET.173.01.1.1]|nr:hypothetical protein EN816_31550 [Mesorhizobium sp. M8A.F.Ca.ET.173.01.1.1]
MRRKSHTLVSEISELEAVLSRIPETSIIERFGFEQRLKAARATLEQAQDSIEPERTQLTFRGLPVRGSQGIYAEFGSKAAVAFTEAFTAIMAGMKDRLNYMGPIPDKARNQPLITGTAVGSFGFEFQLPSLNPDFFSDSGGAEEALERLLGLLQVSAEGTDDDVAELVAEVHPRAVRKVASFLEYLSRNQAWCGLEFKHKIFKYRNVEQLRRSRDRLSEGNIRESRDEFSGELQGVLPRGRTFEFKISGADQILKGRVGLGIEDPDVLNREWLHKPVKILLNVFQVGKSRPSYILADLESIRRV